MSYINGLSAVADHIAMAYLTIHDLDKRTHTILCDICDDISEMIDEEISRVGDYFEKIGLDDD